jgi:hypothetical protein
MECEVMPWRLTKPGGDVRFELCKEKEERRGECTFMCCRSEESRKKRRIGMGRKERATCISCGQEGQRAGGQASGGAGGAEGKTTPLTHESR